MRNKTVKEIQAIVESKGLKFFDTYAKGYNLNLTCFRSGRKGFSDELHISYIKEDGSWFHHIIKQFTSHAGDYYLLNPMTERGCAILKGNEQYKYKGGYHYGKYSLVQAEKVTVFRDNNLDLNFDKDDSTLETDWYAINIHWMYGTTKVGKSSGACQGCRNKSDHDLLMWLYDKSKALYGENITYTLIDDPTLQLGG